MKVNAMRDRVVPWVVTLLLWSVSAVMGEVVKCEGARRLPDGFVGLTASVNGTHHGVEYGLLQACRQDSHQMRLQRIASRDGGIPNWADVFTLALPRLRESERLVFGAWSTCRHGDQPWDPFIIAIVSETGEPMYAVIRQAWRANLRTKNIDQISTTGIVCINDSYGI